MPRGTSLPSFKGLWVRELAHTQEMFEGATLSVVMIPVRLLVTRSSRSYIYFKSRDAKKNESKPKILMFQDILVTALALLLLVVTWPASSPGCRPWPPRAPLPPVNLAVRFDGSSSHGHSWPAEQTHHRARQDAGAPLPTLVSRPQQREGPAPS